MTDLYSKRWMVGLDMSEMDWTLIHWVSELGKKLRPEIIYFVHVENSFRAPDYLPSDLIKSLHIKDEIQTDTIEKLLEEEFENTDIPCQVEVIEGDPFDTLLHWASIKKVDFFVAGRKNPERGRGSLSRKLSRKLSCSVLFVPEKDETNIKRLLVPLDFSEHSMMALETALALADLFDAKVNCLHIYQVPVGYYKTGKSFVEFSEIMRENSVKEFVRFTKKIERDLPIKSVPLDKGTVSELIHEEVEKEGYDLVMVGSKGQSVGSLILLGSSTENLLKINDKCLTWVFKKKDEHIGFFEALSKL